MGKYSEVLKECYDKLSNAEGVNYILCACDAVENDDDKKAIGGQAWNVEVIGGEDSHPDFMSMIGNLVTGYMEGNGYSYTDKVRTVRTLSQEIIEHCTDKVEETDEEE